MTVVAVTMVKDEADIIAATVTHMCHQVDVVIVADNGSTDDTRAILDELAERLPVVVVVDPDVAYTQSAKMTRLAHLAGAEHGATWIVPFDADEIWLGRVGSRRVGDVLAVPRRAEIVTATLYDHVATGADDADEADPTARLQWRRSSPAPLAKVACRYRPDLVIGMGNHEAWYDSHPHVVATGQLTIRHFPYRSAEQLIRKVTNGARAYAATDLPAQYGAHWRQWGQILDQSGPDAIVELFNTWYRHEDPATAKVVDGEQLPALVHDPAAVCR
jgi:glycosyltransferase involved in cell wall biosynthesis